MDQLKEFKQQWYTTIHRRNEHALQYQETPVKCLAMVRPEAAMREVALRFLFPVPGMSLVCMLPAPPRSLQMLAMCSQVTASKKGCSGVAASGSGSASWDAALSHEAFLSA
jgi:hypothetical protein